jgi:hypothetical protein
MQPLQEGTEALSIKIVKIIGLFNKTKFINQITENKNTKPSIMINIQSTKKMKFKFSSKL